MTRLSGGRLSSGAVVLFMLVLLAPAAGAAQSVPPLPEYLPCPVPIGGRILRGLAVGFLNGDAVLDLAGVDVANQEVVVMLPLEDGALFAAGACDSALEVRTVAITTNPLAIDAGDLDQNVTTDLAVAGANGVVPLLGDGAGNFTVPTPVPTGTPTPPTPIPAGTDPQAVAIGDFDHDGSGDIAVGTNSGNSIEILYGNGNGTFQPAISIAIGQTVSALISRDFDGDGRSDLAALSTQSNQVAVLLQRAGIRCTATDKSCFSMVTPVSVDQSPTGFAAGDFNLDGLGDLAVVSRNGLLGIYLGRADDSPSGMHFEAGPSYSVGGANLTAAVAGFFNADVYPDVAVADNNGNRVIFFVNDGAAQMSFTQSPQLFLVNPGPRVLGIADLDGDGQVDIITANENPSFGLTVLLSSNPPATPTGTPTSSPSVTPSPTISGTPTETATSTRTATNTRGPTSTLTETPSQGLFQIRGESCAINAGADSGLSVLPIFALIAFALWRRGRSVGNGKSNVESRSGT